MPNTKLKEIEAALIQALNDAAVLNFVRRESIRSMGESISAGLETFLKSNIAQFPMILVIYGGSDAIGRDFNMINYQEDQTWGVIVADRTLSNEQEGRIGSEAHLVTGTYNLIESIRDTLHGSTLGIADVHRIRFQSVIAITNEDRVSAYALNFKILVEMQSVNS